MDSANLTRAETSARSEAVTVRSYRVELDLRRAQDLSVAGFATTTTVELQTAAALTWLDFIGSEVRAVTVNGRPRPVEFDGARVLIQLADEERPRGGRPPTRQPTSFVVTVHALALYSRTGEGLHRFTDPLDGETYLYTHYEPADARRVFACFEQPDMKAPFTFVVHTPADWTVLSNTEARSREEHDGCQIVVFEPTLPLPSYITAVAAGPYHGVLSSWSRDGRDVPLGVYCRASLAEHLDADEIIDVTRRGLEFFTNAFGMSYPWGKYDQVFVPEYNIGAMENPGCVTFTERYIFRGSATDAQHEGRATTILHEMAHMWFGDLVTMKWWDDLWLKESFADYMGTLATAEATTWTDAWVSFANRRKAWAYLQDQLPTTHPIVADIVDLEAAKLNFDGITYAKGAAVLKQLASYVGRDAFFDGAKQYFRTHAFGNTTLDDLLRALEQASGRDLHAWSLQWLRTSGMTTLTVQQGPAGLVMVPSDDRPHRLAVGWYDADDSGAVVRRELREFDVAGEPVRIGDRDAALVLVNDTDATYAKLRLDDRSLDTVESSLGSVADPLARGLVWAAVWDATRDAEYPTGRYLAVVRQHAPAESNTGLLASVLGNASFAVEHYVPQVDRDGERSRWSAATWGGLFAARPEGGAQLAWARALAAAATVDDSRAHDIRGLLDGTTAAPEGLTLDPDLRWSLLTALAATGHADAEDVERELQRDDTATGRTAFIQARAARPLESVKADAWHSALADTALTNDRLQATIAGFVAGGRRDLTARFDDAYFASLRSVWRERSIEMAERIVVGLFPRSDSTDAVDGWLAANADAPASLVRLVGERRDHLARDLRVRAANARRRAIG